MGSLRKALFTVDRLLKSTSLIQTEASIRPVSNCGIYRFYSESIDLANEESKRRLCNRLIYRSKQRGFLELDLVLGKWVEENIHSMDDNGIKALSYVLNLDNPDLWKWLTGQEQPPEAVKTNPVFTAVSGKVMNNLNAHASPETRAKPGQPWVRGWDDIKRGRDSPITGNQ
ncbi:succinate dehydrogenase assembly factor 2, mitochondrial [Morus notabilis]|uniref:succinate dehydrogenase assembly factor 2, mitochondrial n=1 Tax=Morus notabilis TaxID=981085 RepID=UPI000CED4FC3|nr:succinate dehydrogenase assembly factor 2, mitochondrial [Morus notabilis]